MSYYLVQSFFLWQHNISKHQMVEDSNGFPCFNYSLNSFIHWLVNSAMLPGSRIFGVIWSLLSYLILSYLSHLICHLQVEYIDVGVDNSAPIVNENNIGFSKNVETLYPLPEFASTWVLVVLALVLVVLALVLSALFLVLALVLVLVSVIALVLVSVLVLVLLSSSSSSFDVNSSSSFGASSSSSFGVGSSELY